jgi:hypothetical protein
MFTVRDFLTSPNTDANALVSYIYGGWRVIQERDYVANGPLVSYTRGWRFANPISAEKPHSNSMIFRS